MLKGTFLQIKSIIVVFFVLCVFVASILVWSPSLLVWSMLPLFFIGKRWFNVYLVGLVLVGFLLVFPYLLHSFSQGIGVNAVSEEIPLVGLVFVLHILHYWRKIPYPFTVYGVLLLGLGCLKAKYMFLATPFLIAGLFDKYLREGLHIPKLGIHNIPLIPVAVFLLVGWVVMVQFAYPTLSDMSEMKQAIDMHEQTGIPFYNDWGDGWAFVSLGFDTNYKISYPNPDWNNLEKPFLAYTKEELFGCLKLTKKIQQCN